MNLLVVEDVEPMRELISVLARQALGKLVLEGRVDSAARLADARRLLARHRPDLALLDITLGLESGLDLLAELKEARVPVVILVMDLPPLERPLPKGAYQWFVKPAGRSGAEDLERFCQLICKHRSG